MSWSRFGALLWVLTACVIFTGCDAWNRAKEPAERPEGTLGKDTLEPQPSIANQGTVGERCFVQGVRLMRVKGYSLVIGLAGTGSPQCPTSIRDRLVKEIRRYRSAHPHVEGLPAAEDLIDSINTAVVEVVGEVPAGAVKARTFDVFVKAIDPNTQSLVGGYLLPCELKIFQEVSPARMLEGKTHARARGPVFINPFRESGAEAADTDLLSGLVIGGGVNEVERKLRLVSTVESYARVRAIAEAINRRFSRDPKTADPYSPTNIELRVPPEFIGREGRFLGLVLHLPLSQIPIEREARAKILVGELVRPDTPLEDVAQSLEGLGKAVLPVLQEMYTDPRREVNYYAARTGLRLGHELAFDVVARHARDERSPFRLRAIRELGDCTMRRRAALVLGELVSDEDPRIRILAYEALRDADSSALAKVVVGENPGNFILEVVPTDGPALIYARRSNTRRIALIGGDHVMCRPPLFYSQPGKPITLSAQPGDNMITILMKMQNGAAPMSLIGPFKTPMSVMILTQFMGNAPTRAADGRLEGLGLDYAVVLDVLYRLCDSGAIDADMRWEEPSVEDLVGPLAPIGRPESDL
jgi:flagellar basal body P-ring protein FlgI